MIEMPRGRRKQDADDLVLDEAQPFGAAPPVPVLEQHRLSHRAGRDHFCLQELRQSRAKYILAPGMLLGQFIDCPGDPRGIEPIVGLRSGWCRNAVHDLTGYRTAPVLSLIILRWQKVHAAFGRL
jgi:hypothetical protein